MAQKFLGSLQVYNKLFAKLVSVLKLFWPLCGKKSHRYLPVTQTPNNLRVFEPCCFVITSKVLDICSYFVCFASYPDLFRLFFPANLSPKGHSSLLSEHPSGVYFGWAGLSTRGVYKMVMSIGWNPYFNNAEKTIVSAIITWMLTTASLINDC